MTANEGLLVLESETARLVLDPHAGGAVREYSCEGVDVLRPTPGGARDPFAMACFPMVPYVNRIAGGVFRFAGRAVQLSGNWSEEPHPLHGQGWRASWAVATVERASAALTFEGGGDEWPWRYRAEQRFHLSENTLSIGLSVQNLSDAAMPAMLGLHPYFPEAAQARLAARLPRVWVTDEAALPLAETPAPADWRFDPPRGIQTVALDHCFAGWDGRATLEWPRRSVHLRAQGCAFLQVYAPSDHDFFCIEPQTAPTGALARAAAELIVVAPAECASIAVQLRIAAR